uniref:Uncharacterized protein n=1 Tax=Cyprinus carpio TaxID=7962 RepID=A0A8C2FGK8_CYPCA
MLCLCLYLPVDISERIELQYFESDSLPVQLKSLFKLSLFLPSQEFDSYRKWRKVCHLKCQEIINVNQNKFNMYTIKWIVLYLRMTALSSSKG